jgi:hypothetical protein
MRTRRPDRPGGVVRVIRAWRELTPERRLAVFAALLLFVSLFLPWYQESVIASGKATSIVSATESLTGWGAFSWVEAAVLLVSVGVIVLIFQRADGRAFHVPGGDGWAVTVAGGWTCFLIVYRMFDKQGTTEYRQYATTAGIEWGIFIALGVAVLLTVAGVRIRAANGPEPALPRSPGRASTKGASAPRIEVSAPRTMNGHRVSSARRRAARRARGRSRELHVQAPTTSRRNRRTMDAMPVRPSDPRGGQPKSRSGASPNVRPDGYPPSHGTTTTGPRSRSTATSDAQRPM